MDFWFVRIFSFIPESWHLTPWFFSLLFAFRACICRASFDCARLIKGTRTLKNTHYMNTQASESTDYIYSYCHIHMYTCTHNGTYTCSHKLTHARIHTKTWMHTHTNTNLYFCTNIHAHAHMHKRTHTRNESLTNTHARLRTTHL